LTEAPSVEAEQQQAGKQPEGKHAREPEATSGCPNSDLEGAHHDRVDREYGKKIDLINSEAAV
jgi:hypothetical protein